MSEIYIYLIYLVFGLLTGIAASLFGFGGGFIVVPVLVWLLPFQNVPSELVMHSAVITSLAIMIINSSNATYIHHKNRNILWDIVRCLSPFIAIGSLLGVWSLKFFSDSFIKTGFIIFLSYTIIDCVVRRKFIHASVDKGLFAPSALVIRAYGTFIGFVATVLGVGGSVMTVPLLRRWHAKMGHATATANPLSLTVALVGSFGYMAFGSSYDVNLPSFVGLIYLPAFIGFSLGGFGGIPIGVKISKFIPDKAFARIYIVLLMIMLLAMIVKQVLG